MRWRMKLTTHTVWRIGSQTRTPATRYRRRLRFFGVPGPSIISAPLLARPPLGRGARRARFGFGGFRRLGLLGRLGLRRRRLCVRAGTLAFRLGLLFLRRQQIAL